MQIVHDGLTQAAAENLEDVIARTHGPNLVNDFNQHRDFDFHAWEKHNALMLSSRAHAQAAIQLEKTDWAAAIVEHLIALRESRAADLIEY